MNMTPYTFTIKRTPRGKYYCIVTIGKDAIYVSRKVFDTGEEAHVDAREYLHPSRQGSAGNDEIFHQRSDEGSQASDKEIIKHSQRRSFLRDP